MLFIFVVACVLVGLLGSVATRTSVNTWYATLSKPSWTPPSSIFGPVWTSLYILMGIAAWLVWREGMSNDLRLALTVFGIQLALNLAWSFLFFWSQSPGAAFIDIVLLWAAIVATVFLFARVKATAAWLLAPYLVWVTYAAALNLSIWQRNS